MTTEERVSVLERQLAEALEDIESLKDENASLSAEIKDLEDYDDDEIRAEFSSRGLSDLLTIEYERLADHIARGDTDEALSLLAEISEGEVSPAIAKMLVKARAQESLL